MLLLTIVWAAGFVTQADGNLLTNPGFEQLDAVQKSAVGWRLLAGPRVSIQENGGRTGPRFARFSDPSPSEGVSLESEHVAVRPGATYTASAWFRSSDRVQPGVYLQFHGISGERIAEVHAQAPCPSKNWIEATITAAAPPDAEEVSVLLYSFVGDVGGFDADDVKLTVVGGCERAGAVRPGTKDRVEIGSRLELFVDNYMIDNLSGDARRVLHSPAPREVALAFDAPWEGRDSTYVTVMQDDDRVRLYYRGVGNKGLPEVTCYADSRDGVTFTRPKLGLFEVARTKENNVCWTGVGTHNFAPFKDRNPAARPAERYKALAGGPLVALASPDGIHWKRLAEEPVITKGAFDSQNLAFFDAVRGDYVAFFRDFARGVRTVKVCRSKDFLKWTEPEWFDFGKAPPEHLYTNATVAYFRAPHVYLSFPKRFMEQRVKDPKHPDTGISDGVLMSSRDGVHWERWEEAFLRPGLEAKNWTDRNMMIAWGLVPSSPEEISLYWTEHYSFDTCRLRRGTIRTDGFVSVAAGMASGAMLTRPFTFTGKRLTVNYSTSAAGSLRFELQDEAGKPIPGFELSASEVLFGDEIAHAVVWKKGAEVASLAGKPVRLRVSLRDADLYSFTFGRPGR